MKNYLLGRYRLSRAKYWRYITIISVSFSIIYVLYVLATGGGHFLELKRIILILISSLLFTSIVLFPLSIARLHDIGYSNFKILLYYIFIMSLYWIGEIIDKEKELHTNSLAKNGNKYETAEYSLYMLQKYDQYQQVVVGGLAILVIIFLTRLLKKGQHYTNKWGVNPNDKYEGELNNGKRNGEGTCYFANGDIYIGQFKDNHMHGKGIYKHTDGTIDEGLWEDDNFLNE